MNIIETQELTASQKEAIYTLWNQEYSEKLVHRNMASLEEYLDGLFTKVHLFLIDDNNKIKGWAFLFVRNNEIWFAIILDSSLHGKGYGTQLLNALKDKEPILNGWVTDHNNDTKLNGDIYRSPLDFYLKNNFTVCSDTRIDTPKLSAVKIVWQKHQ